MSDELGWKDAAGIAMGSMICIWSVPLRELAMATEGPMELASRRVPANCYTGSGWFPMRQEPSFCKDD